jgi:2-keto-4-pentenoate hydratase
MIDAGDAAVKLLEEHEAKQNFQSIRERFPFEDIETAYTIQEQFVRRLRAKNGAGITGYKIGLTSPRMQAMCGIPHPIAGTVLTDRVFRSGMDLRVSDFVHLGVECEIAVKIGADLTADSGITTIEGLTAFVAGIAPGLELVEDRHADYKALDMLTLIADDSWNAGIMLGDFRRSWPDLTSIEGVLEVNDAEIDRGHGRDVMGHPFEPLLWLCRHLWSRNESLRAGDIVMTGSLVPTRFPLTGDHYRFSLAGLGSIEASFT